jgi:hypothetical protein
MKDWRSQAHVTWECKYHVVFVPEYRRKMSSEEIRMWPGARDVHRLRAGARAPLALSTNHGHSLLLVLRRERCS